MTLSSVKFSASNVHRSPSPPHRKLVRLRGPALGSREPRQCACASSQSRHRSHPAAVGGRSTQRRDPLRKVTSTAFTGLEAMRFTFWPACRGRTASTQPDR
jgi:hypothetical protein